MIFKIVHVSEANLGTMVGEELVGGVSRVARSFPEQSRHLAYCLGCAAKYADLRNRYTFSGSWWLRTGANSTEVQRRFVLATES